MDVFGLYPIYVMGLRSISKKTEDIVRMSEFVLKNNFFVLNGEVKQQYSGTTIGTKFAPPYACIFVDEVEAVS